jgi:excisionase family DNA binding protein
MLGLIMFLVGLFLLFKGGFTFGSRTIARMQSRIIAFALMAPLVITFCMAYILLSNSVQFGENGSFTLDENMVYEVFDRISGFDLILMIAALVLVGYTIYSAPKGVPPALRQTAGQPQTQGSATFNRIPDIMTVAEAAAYMRVTEADVISLIDQGKLGAARIGDSYRIARIAIEDFMRPS